MWERQLCSPRMSRREGPLKEMKTRTKTTPLVSVPAGSASGPLLITLHASSTCPGPGSVQGRGKQRGNILAPVPQAPPRQEC